MGRRMKQELARYLDKEYRAWMDREGRRRDLKEFADFLGIPKTTLSELMDPENPRLPGKANRDRMAMALESNEINEIMGEEANPLADPEIAEFIQEIRNLDKKDRDTLKKQIKFLAEEDHEREVMPVGG